MTADATSFSACLRTKLLAVGVVAVTSCRHIMHVLARYLVRHVAW